MRGNAPQVKVHYKGQEDDFIVFVDSAEAVKKWKTDKTIPMAQVVSGFKVFVTHKHGTQGVHDAASKGTMETEFGTSKDDDVIAAILEKGDIVETESQARNGDRNINSGPSGTRQRIWASIIFKIPSCALLPAELRAEIVHFLLGTRWVVVHPHHTVLNPGERKTPRIPPASGACPFLKLPTEIRRAIFAGSLPHRNIVIEPTCGPTDTDDESDENRWRRNRTADLMRICKGVKEEVTEAVYEERTFAVHVHEGFLDGGIEFVNSGRQPLQYATGRNLDTRFSTKIHDCNEFGFSRLKRINVAIFPGDGSKHLAINTYFMNYALADALSTDRGDKKRITKLRIHIREHVPPHNLKHRGATIARGSTYWWDAEKGKPRETSIHGLSNVQLVLLPFARLTDVHNIEVVLPQQVFNHAPTRAFVERLESHMTFPGGRYPDLINDRVEYQIQSAREALEEYVYDLLRGGHGATSKVVPLTDAELEEEKAEKHQQRPAKLAKRRRKEELALTLESSSLAELMDILGNITFQDARQILLEHDGNVQAAVNDYLDKGGMIVDSDSDDWVVEKPRAARTSLSGSEDDEGLERCIGSITTTRADDETALAGS
nr:hypothetical protein B0A51_07939 [Rachicladosporium sp. CCFEE 5018]